MNSFVFACAVFRIRIGILVTYTLISYDGIGDYGSITVYGKKLVDGQELELANIQFKTILTPVHTSGSMCYYIENENVLFSGDMLFRESVGRTDFYLGNTDDLMLSIKEKLFTLPPETTVLSGHGPDTSIGEEKANNPFVY